MRRSWHLKYSIRDKEVGSILLRHQVKKYPDLASIRFRIDSSVFRHFHSGERIQNFADTYAGHHRGQTSKSLFLFFIAGISLTS